MINKGENEMDIKVVSSSDVVKAGIMLWILSIGIAVAWIIIV